MKKILTLLAVVAASITFAACSGGNGGGTYDTYGCVEYSTTSGSELTWVKIDSPEAGSAIVYSNGAEQTLTYTNTGTHYTFFYQGIEEANAYISGGFMTTKNVDSPPTLGYCIQIDPAKTNMNYAIGMSGGGQSLGVGDPSGVSYSTEVVAADGDIAVMEGTSITESPVPAPLPCSLTIADLNAGFSPTGYYFSLGSEECGAYRLNIFPNESGYQISQTMNGSDLLAITILSEDPATSNIPSGIAVGDVYNGYAGSLNEGEGWVVDDFSLAVDAKSDTTLTLGLTIGGVFIGSAEYSPVTTEGWGTGFYAIAGGDVAIRIFGSDAILITSFDGRDYFFGLAVK